MFVDVPGKGEIRLFEHYFRARYTEHYRYLIERVRQHRVENVDDLTGGERTHARFFQHLFYEFDIHLQSFAVYRENVACYLFGKRGLRHQVFQNFVLLVARRRVQYRVDDFHYHIVAHSVELAEYFRKIEMLVVNLRKT